MKTPKDSFSIDIVLRHPTRSPESISASLSLKPKVSWRAGKHLGKLRTKWSFFHGHLLDGIGSSKYESALKNVLKFLRRNDDFWTDFKTGNGESELILNHTVLQEEEGDKCFELLLTPEFLRELSARDIGVTVRGWQGKG